jgi:hypothetical protein
VHSISTSVPSGSSRTPIQVRAYRQKAISQAHFLLTKCDTHWQVIWEELEVDLVHGAKVAHRGQVDVRLNNLLKVGAGVF